MFSKDIILHNAMHVPKFNLNLISGFQIAASLHCKLIFDNLEYVIQDRHSMKQIGHAEALYNLFVAPLFSKIVL